MLTRRQFIKSVMAATAALQLSDFLIPQLAEALTGKKKPPVIWLEMMTCTGDYLSVANTLHPNMRELLFDTIDLYFSNTTMAGEGYKAIDALTETVEREKGEYILIAEGTVPLKAGGRYGAIGHHRDGRLFTDLEAIKLAAPNAKYIMAVGTCASFGGPYAAYPNPSGSVPVHKVVDQQVVNVPGCPVHPDWAIGTLTHLLLYGIPDLDAFNRPMVFYGRRIHDWCPRRQHFDNGVFAKHPGEEKCTYRIGCKGPVTYVDCPTRQWNSEHNSWPVEANSPCIGCVNPDFPDGMSPFYAHMSNTNVLGLRTAANKVGLGVAGLVAGGIGTHFLVNVATGRFGKHMVDGTEPRTEGEIRDIRKHSGEDPSVVTNCQDFSSADSAGVGTEEVVFLPHGRVKEVSLKRYYVKKKLTGPPKTGLYNSSSFFHTLSGKNRRHKKR